MKLLNRFLQKSHEIGLNEYQSFLSIYDVNGLISQYILKGQANIWQVLAYEQPEPSSTPTCFNIQIKIIIKHTYIKMYRRLTLYFL